jgi:hypothetical protein
VHDYKTIPVVGVVQWSEMWSSGQRCGPVDHHLRIGWEGPSHNMNVISGWGVISTLFTRCYLSVLSFLDFKAATEKANTKWRKECQAPTLLGKTLPKLPLGHLQAQVRSQCLLAKVVSKYVLYDVVQLGMLANELRDSLCLSLES